MVNNIVNQEYRNSSYKDFKFFIANDKCTNKFKSVYQRYLEKEKISNCFEIWCFPWRYLAYISKLWDYEANGVDITPELNEAFINWLKKNGIKIGKIINDDAFNYIDKLCKNKKFFDLTYSFWFIEHFTKYLDVIDYHIKATKKNWYIFICTPNFAGWYQRFMHIRLDKDNYDRHVIKSMNPMEWADFMKKKGCDVIEYGYFWNFDFWVDKISNNVVKKAVTYFNLLLAKLNIPLPNRKFYSPYCYILAKKHL